MQIQLVPEIRYMTKKQIFASVQIIRDLLLHDIALNLTGTIQVVSVIYK